MQMLLIIEDPERVLGRRLAESCGGHLVQGMPAAEAKREKSGHQGKSRRERICMRQLWPEQAASRILASRPEEQAPGTRLQSMQAGATGAAPQASPKGAQCVAVDTFQILLPLDGA